MDLPEALLETPGKSLDFKVDTGDRQEILRTVVGFSNSGGGTIFLGVDPATRDVRGMADPLAAAERIEGWIGREVRPRPAFQVEVVPWRQIHVVAVRVHPGPSPPYHLKGAGLEGGVMVRGGAENRIADPALIEELRRSARGDHFDEQPCPDQTLADLDVEAARRAFQRAGKSFGEADLDRLRLVGPESVPSVGAMLLFGKRRLDLYQDAWIQAGRFQGPDRSRILDSAELREDLPSAVEAAMAFALRNLTRSSIIEGVRRVEEHAVPPVALREALVNAVVHADYTQRGAPIRLAIHDDRIEITSPGLLPSGLTLKDLDKGISRVRNRVLGRVFHALGMVEQWGSGVARMREALASAGLAAPVFEEVGLAFRVVLPTQRLGPPAADARDGEILQALAEEGPLSTGEVAARLGLSDRAIRSRLRSLVERGLVAEIGSARTDPQRKYAVIGASPPGRRPPV